MTDMTHKEQIMKIDNNSEEDIKPDDFIGSNRPTISLRVGDKIGSNGPIDWYRGENERGEVSKRVDEKRDESADEKGLITQDEIQIRDEYDVGEA